MFDPTVFDNIKVVLEGGLYDLEREGAIRVAGREDLVDLASLSRTFRMRFFLPDDASGVAEIELSSGLSDFAAELARLRIAEPSPPGCRLQIRYRFERWEGGDSHLAEIARAIRGWWSDEAEIWQVIESYHQIGERDCHFQTRYRASLEFSNKIREEHIGELQRLLRHLAQTLEKLTALLRRLGG